MNEFLFPLIFLVAVAYASVGHGGASGYLAVLALFGFPHAQMASSALILNILVSAIAFLAFWKQGYFSVKLFWIFAVTSIPGAFIGGLIQVPVAVYGSLLFVSLTCAALRMFFYKQTPAGEKVVLAVPPASFGMAIGFFIGLVSGIVGVGGGIFLSPLLILMGWADAKHTAAVSAAFVLVNSMAGLFGHIQRASPMSIDIWPLAMIAFVGGSLGALWGARWLGNLTLRRILGGVLGLAATKSLLLVWR